MCRAVTSEGWNKKSCWVPQTSPCFLLLATLSCHCLYFIYFILFYFILFRFVSFRFVSFHFVFCQVCVSAFCLLLPGCPEMLWMSHPWRCSRPGWMGTLGKMVLWLTVLPMADGIKTRRYLRYFPTQAILQFCDSMSLWFYDSTILQFYDLMIRWFFSYYPDS